MSEVPAWVARLPRYRWRQSGPYEDTTGNWVRYADLVAACPPPLPEVNDEEDQARMATPANPESPLTATAVSDPPTILEGIWPANDIRRAFVQGAKWWEWHSRQATMWPSDRNLAEDEAERRYGLTASQPWHPIATAPKVSDGRRVLLASSFGVRIGQWNSGSGWLSLNYGQPTHWMPLPDLPSVLSGLPSDSAPGDAVSVRSSDHRDGAFAGDDLRDPTTGAACPPPQEDYRQAVIDLRREFGMQPPERQYVMDDILSRLGLASILAASPPPGEARPRPRDEDGPDDEPPVRPPG